MAIGGWRSGGWGAVLMAGEEWAGSSIIVAPPPPVYAYRLFTM